MSAAELLHEAFDQGVNIYVDGGNLVCRSAEPLSPELQTRLKSNKATIIRLLEKRKYGTPYLAENGEFRVRGGLHKGSILDALLEVGASDTEIEKHIGPIHQPEMWKQWQEIKQGRFTL